MIIVKFVMWLVISMACAQTQDDLAMLAPVNTNFSCKGRRTGFYADIETDCAVYHNCDNHGNKFTYHCPKETKFRQEILVCDHAHLVNCKNAEKLISQPDNDRIGTDDTFRLSSMLSRSFKITPSEPSTFLQPPRENSKKSTTFTMRSTVFLRDSKTASTQSPKSKDFRAQPFDRTRQITGKTFDSSMGMKSSQRDNYQYTETLKSIQGTTPAATTLAGTEFPIPAFDGQLSEVNEDPYYPKGTSTETYYMLKAGKIHISRFSTQRPFVNSPNVKIPEILPDFNTIDDLVDRRKILYIPKAKSL